MANLIQWASTWTDRGVVLTSCDCALASSGFNVGSCVYPGDTALDQYGCLVVNWASTLNSTSNSPAAYVNVYAVPARDGSTYCTGSSGLLPAVTCLVAAVPLQATSSVAMIVPSRVFPLEPTLTKFAIENKTAATIGTCIAMTVNLYTNNDEVQ